MKKIFLSLLTFAVYQGIAQQSFTGLRSSTYGGAMTTLSNPAYALGARPWDVNLVSVDANLGNNDMTFSFDLENSFQKFTDGLSNSKVIDAGLTADVLGPSAIFRINKKHALGLITRMRVMANTTGIDAKVLQGLIGVGNMQLPTNPAQYYKVQGINEMNLLVNAFRDIGAVWSYTVMNDGYNLIRLGAGVKLVQGTGSYRMGFSGVNQDNVTLRRENGDVIMHIADGQAEVRSGGLDVFASSVNVLETHATTVGFDLGVVYEFNENGCPNCDGHVPYRFRVGVSLLDLGKLSYTTNSNSYNYTIHNQDFALNDMQGSLDRIPTQAPLRGTSFTSSLPTTLNIDLDYRFIDGLYLNLSNQINVVSKNEYNAHYVNDFVLTPRYETRLGPGIFGAFLPISYNQISKFNVGTGFHIGPFVFGSRSILGNLTGGAKEMNFFFGLRFGGMYE
ncbi:DUF5723 family protein [Capnocytophaga gingivalis]